MTEQQDSEQEASLVDVNELPFFWASKTKFLILSLLSFGLYVLFWFYKNWKALKRDRYPDILPFWRTFFCVFTSYSFVRAVNDEAKERAIEPPLNAGLIFAVFFLLSLSGRLPDPWWLISMLSFVPLLPVAERIQAINRTAIGDGIVKEWTRPSYIALAIFTPIAVATVSLAFGPPTYILRGNEMPSSYLRQLSEAGIVSSDESVVFFQSYAFLSILDDGELLTSKRVVSYEKKRGALSITSIEFQEMKNVSVDDGEGAFYPTVVTITTKAGEELIIALYTEKRRDREYVEELKRRANGALFSTVD